MGTYTELSIAGYPVLSSESSVMPILMTVFREGDKRVFKRRFTERNPLVWGPFDPLDKDVLEEAVEYACDISKVTDRLDVMGFNLGRVKQEFHKGLKVEIDKYRCWVEADRSATWFIEHYRLLQSLNFEGYLEGLKYVVGQGLKPGSFNEEKNSQLSPVVKYILKRNDDFPFGCFTRDIRCLLRIFCEVAEKPGLVVQDITELVQSGHCEAHAPVCENESRALKEGHPENSNRIIITESSTDAAILGKALSVLYPHLAEYYSFLDLGESRAPNGSGQLATLMTSLARAGITNRIIAVFANDALGNEALRSLSAVKIPRNIALVVYPELEKLRSYPTLGPNGKTNFNVNGLAGSIELYLGEDVLRGDSGTLIPVQWKGYMEPVGRYQGEVLRKPQIRLAFDRKVQLAERDPSAKAAQDWSGLTAILQRIFHAFE